MPRSQCGANNIDVFLFFFWPGSPGPRPLLSAPLMPDAALSRRPRAATTAVASFVRGVRARPRAATVGGLWLLGLFLAFLAPAPVTS